MSSMPQFMMRAAFVFACFTAGASVLIAAYSVHVPGLEESSVRSVNSAIQMMQFHALALLVVSRMNQAAKAKWLLIAGLLFFVLGIALFSFNIVLHQLASVSTFRPLIPFGGMAFVLGWVALGISAMPSRQP